MTASVFIDGEAGTTGLQIRDRLIRRDDVRLVQVDPARRKDPAARAALISPSAACMPVRPTGASATGIDTGNPAIVLATLRPSISTATFWRR